MSVSLAWPANGATLTAADGLVADGKLTVTVRGSGPRRTPVFVNEAVVETDAEGGFTARVELPPGEAWLAAGLLTGCATVTQRVVVTVEL